MSTNTNTNTNAPALTPELEERIRKNRERALQIQAERKRKLQEEKGHDEERDTEKKKGRVVEEVDCEDWEVGLSEWVSKKEAVAKYCLPEGTLAVCEVSMKENPHHKGWAPMKLYKRSELRERAYKRFGGKEGLIEERMKREQKRLSKDLKVADNIFKS